MAIFRDFQNDEMDVFWDVNERYIHGIYMLFSWNHGLGFREIIPFYGRKNSG